MAKGSYPNKTGNQSGRQYRQWHLVKIDYQTTSLSTQQLADKHGLTYAAVNDKIHRDKWRKDLQEIQKQTEVLLRESGLEWQKTIRELSKAYLLPAKLILEETQGKLEPQAYLQAAKALKTVDDMSRRSHGLSEVNQLDITSKGQSLGESLVDAIKRLRETKKTIDISDEEVDRIAESE